MDRNEKKPGLHRRMMAALGLGTAAAAAVLATGRPARAMVPPGNKAGAKYTESEHVKQYYRVNRY